MITASEAKSLLIQNEQLVVKKLDDIECKIRQACGKGENIIQIDVKHEEWVLPLVDKLRAAGFNSNKIHSKGIDVRW